MESFNDSLKKEEVYLVSYFDYDAVSLAIHQYMKYWCNSKRIHGSIG
ncbi:IS3 family transposase [Clostridium amazonitimonense]